MNLIKHTAIALMVVVSGLASASEITWMKLHDFLKVRSLCSCYLVPSISPKLEDDDLLGSVDPALSPQSVVGIAKIVESKELAVLKTQLSKKPELVDVRNPNYEVLEILMFGESGDSFVCSLIRLDGVYYLRLDANNAEGGFVYLKCTKEAVTIFDNNLIDLKPGK